MTLSVSADFGPVTLGVGGEGGGGVTASVSAKGVLVGQIHYVSRWKITVTH